MEQVREMMRDKSALIAIVDRALRYDGRDCNDKPPEFLVNVETLLKEYSNIPSFDESQRSETKVLFLMGSRSTIFPFGKFRKVFPRVHRSDIKTLEAGHWVHFERPVETMNAIASFLD